ncbi:hypothetical protein CRN50_15050 [Vibrio vulnificus]|nr:hypothetical protein CRN35_01390 [Vibrio vulnificus]POB97113.1 hypothetical protein CRN53_04725 [Vibrio vulnificus]POC32440.1 hypothetical protein CRN50_15050 [Vibrio vulnificus]
MSQSISNHRFQTLVLSNSRYWLTISFTEIWLCTHTLFQTTSRVRRCRLIPLTEPYVRASYTAHAHFHSA